MKNKTPSCGKIRICSIIALMISLSNFFMIQITQNENRKITNEEDILENFVRSMFQIKNNSKR